MFISLYTIILACSALFTGFLSLFILKYRTSRASHEFVFLLVAMSWWSAMVCLESCSDTLNFKIFWSQVSYLGSQYAPVLFFLFALRYTQMDTWFTPGKKAALFILPTISLLVAATNSLHHLLWADISLAESAFTGIYAIYTHGSWYWVEIAYSYSLLMAGVVALILASIRYPLLNSLQYRWILVASIVSIVGNAVYAFFFSYVQGIDPTPLLLSITTILIAIGISRFRILDIIPIAREQVLDCMKEGMITIDQKNRIIDINPAAIGLLNLPCTMTGQVITDFLPWWPSVDTVLTEQSGVLPLQVDDTTRWLAWSAAEIHDAEEGPAGVYMLIQDVTAHHAMEEQLQNQAVYLQELTKQLSSAHKSLQLMTSITRHDILNMVTVQRGYMEIALAEKTRESYEMAIKNAYPAVLKVQELITFTHEYQQIGTSQPAWTSLTFIIKKVTRLFSEAEEVISSSVSDSIDVYADPLFEKVFFVLIDNALRHGKEITRLHFSCTNPGDLIIVCEDNGGGIPESEKEKIFYRGIGKNTGLGLYLAREILVMNECTIRETGKVGAGARFEIILPRNRWRETGEPGTRTR